MVEKAFGHAYDVPHASTITICRYSDKSLVLIRRPKGKSYAGCRDCAVAGHLMFGETPYAGAVRELHEEAIWWENDRRVPITATLVQIGPERGLVSQAAHNNEFSTIFGLTVPAGVEWHAWDSLDDGSDVELEVVRMELGELLAAFRANPEDLADGLARVLREIDLGNEYGKAILRFIETGHK